MATTAARVGMIFDTEFNSAAQVSSGQCVDAAILAEHKGFGCVWKGESNSRDPMVLLAAMAARTRRIALGTAVDHLFGRTPVSLAIQAATMNDLSGGRLILGLGVANPTIAGWHGQRYEKPLRQMREYVDILRATYAGRRVDYAGEYFQSSGFKLAFDPPPHPLRIWIAALGPQMSRLAGRISDGIIINLANPAMIREIVQRFREGARDAGRDAAALDVVSKVRVSINEDLDQARSTLKKVLTFYVLAHGYRELLSKMGWGRVVQAAQEAYRQGGFRAARQQIPNEMLEDVPMVAATNLDGLSQRLAGYREAGSTRCVVACVVSGEDVWKEITTFLEMIPISR